MIFLGDTGIRRTLNKKIDENLRSRKNGVKSRLCFIGDVGFVKRSFTKRSAISWNFSLDNLELFVSEKKYLN